MASKPKRRNSYRGRAQQAAESRSPRADDTQLNEQDRAHPNNQLASSPLAGLVMRLRRTLRRCWPLPHPFDAFLVSRLGLVLAVAVGMAYQPEAPIPDDVVGFLRGSHLGPVFPDQLWLDGWVRWDAPWYYTIFLRGYQLFAGEQSNVAFFPLLPLLAGLLAYPLALLWPLKQAFYLAALLISHVSFYVALVGVGRLAAPILKPKDARRAIWLLCLFPYALYYSAPYTESLFLALTVWALLYGRERHWARACALAALASATRSVGVMLAPLLLLEYLRQKRFRWRELDASIFYLALAPLGLLCFIGWQWYALDEPLAFVKVLTSWNRSLGFPPIKLILFYATSSLIDPLSRLELLSQAALALALPVWVVAAWWRCGWYLGLWSILCVIAPLTSGTGTSLGRYSSVVFPLFFAVAPVLRRRWLLLATLVVSTTLLLIFTYGFSHWRPPV